MCTQGQGGGQNGDYPVESFHDFLLMFTVTPLHSNARFVLYSVKAGNAKQFRIRAFLTGGAI